MPMRWEDERYVRLYTRKTADWNSWGWDAQCLFCQLLMVADRLGVIELGRHGKRGVALAVGHPEERVLPALEVLLADGVVVLSEAGDKLIIRNFPEAQESRTSDRERKRIQRERDRAALRSELGDKPSPPVTPRPKRSPKVTPGHEMSPCAVPSLAVPSLPEPPLPSEAGPPPPVENLLEAQKDRALRLWGLMQEARCARHPTLQKERTPEHAQLTAMLKPVRTALGDEQTFEAYCRFLEDAYGGTLKPKWPIQLFLAQWERHVAPPETPRAACVVCHAPAEAAIGPGVPVCYAHVGEFRQAHRDVERPWELAADWAEMRRAEVAA